MGNSFTHKDSSIVQRISRAEVLEDPWFKQGYKPEKNKVDEEINIDDVNMVFNDSKV